MSIAGNTTRQRGGEFGLLKRELLLFGNSVESFVIRFVLFYYDFLSAAPNGIRLNGVRHK